MDTCLLSMLSHNNYNSTRSKQTESNKTKLCTMILHHSSQKNLVIYPVT